MTRKQGRNDPCPCGSGKKFKKCCLNTKLTKTDETVRKDKVILTTITEEPVMPIRLYYTIKNNAALIKRLENIECIHTQGNDTYIICYEHEVKKIGVSKFSKKYNNMVLQKNSAIILANCKIIGKNNLYIDLKSHNRAINIIKFIDNSISRETIEITHAATYNEMFIVTDYKTDAQTVAYDRYDEIFSFDKLVEIMPEEAMKKLKSNVKEGNSKEEVARKIEKKLHEETAKHSPLVEKFPVHFYTDGIGRFEMILGFKANVAMEHARGNKNYTTYDAVKNFVNFAASEKL